MANVNLTNNEQLTSSKPIDGKRIWWVSILTILAAVVANVLVRALAFALFPLPQKFIALQVPPIVTFTFAGALGAVIAFILVYRFSRNPFRVYTIIALVTLVLSLIPDLLLLTDSSNPQFAGVTVSAVIMLMLLHVVTALVCVGLLTTLTRRSRTAQVA